MERPLLIYTPWQLEAFDDAQLNVIYVFDAQDRSLFDLVHSTVNFYGPLPMPSMVVGIESPSIRQRSWNRNTEMLPAPDNPEWIGRYRGNAGKADSMLLFVEQELKPWVEQHYPTLPRRVAIGHSNGANLILHAMLEKPCIFTDYLAFSPNFGYDDQRIVRNLRNYEPPFLPYRPFLYVSRGNESSTTGFHGWDTAADTAWQQLNTLRTTATIVIVTKTYPEQNHSKAFVRGLPDALEHFFASAFQNGSNTINYLQLLVAEGHRSLNPDLLNGLTYYMAQDGHHQDASELLAFAVERFPNDSNLRKRQGEVFELRGNTQAARKAYKSALAVLKVKRSELSDEEYDRRHEAYLTRLLGLEDREAVTLTQVKCRREEAGLENFIGKGSMCQRGQKKLPA